MEDKLEFLTTINMFACIYRTPTQPWQSLQSSATLMRSRAKESMPMSSSRGAQRMRTTTNSVLTFRGLSRTRFLDSQYQNTYRYVQTASAGVSPQVSPGVGTTSYQSFYPHWEGEHLSAVCTRNSGLFLVVGWSIGTQIAISMYLKLLFPHDRIKIPLPSCLSGFIVK